MKTKICSKCNKRKKITKFSKSKSFKDGYKVWCKSCIKIYNQKWYEENKTKVKTYQLKNKIKIRKQEKIYKLKNKEKIRKYSKKYREEHKEELSENHKKYRKLNPWLMSYFEAKRRCNKSNRKNYKYYGGRGIKMQMTKEEFKYLWFRDKAYKMKQASIDRKDDDGNYTLKNCRYLEMSENIGKANRRRKR